MNEIAVSIKRMSVDELKTAPLSEIYFPWPPERTQDAIDLPQRRKWTGVWEMITRIKAFRPSKPSAGLRNPSEG